MRDLFSITLAEIWNLIKSPKFVIAYMAVMVLLMGLVVVAAMVNERRLSKINENLKRSAAKAEGQVNADVCRFEMLRAIDEQMDACAPAEFERDFDLARLCSEFRNYAAGELGLFYGEDTIRAFVAGMGTSHFIILQGMSGTGKTSLAFAFGEFLKNSSAVIPVQPMWKERSDMLGYYNEFTKHFNETPLLCKMYEANLSEQIYITILDELNIARVEYYFAEFLSLMEIPNPELRYLEIVSDKWDTDPKHLRNGAVKLPQNMWFLGTANNDDSTFAISDKVYDRAMVIELDRKAEPFEAQEWHCMPVSAADFCAQVERVLQNNTVSAQTRDKLNQLDAYLQQHFHVSFGNRVMRQLLTYLPLYVACGGSEREALDDFLAKKVLRKLEMQSAAYRKKDSAQLAEFTEKLFEGEMPRCVQFIRGIGHNG